MFIGYARVSTGEQNLDLQLLALKKAGCKKIFQEKISGKAKSRPKLDATLAALKPGDTLVVWHLDRLGRRARELLNLEYEFKRQGVELKSLTQNIDTTTADGEYHFHMTCANAQLESARISARTLAGLQAARLRGKFPGRPPCLKQKQIEAAQALIKKKVPLADIAHKFNVGETTLRRALKRN